MLQDEHFGERDGPFFLLCRLISHIVLVLDGKVCSFGSVLHGCFERLDPIKLVEAREELE